MTTSAERRRTERKRVYLAGEIIDPAGEEISPIDCAIRSLSPIGANLRAPSSAPEVFDLRLVRDGSVRQAKTVWACGDQRGVAFVGAEDKLPPKRLSILELRRSLRVIETNPKN